MFARFGTLALAVAALGSPPSFATGVSYYVLQGIDKTQNDDVIADERVSGFTIRVSWRQLHQEGFAWLDEQMARGDQLDRDIQLRVMAGSHAPQGLPNVSYYQYVDGDGTIDSAPVPWDPDLLPHWKALVDQLETRYASHPRLKFVHLPGFADSSEMHTPEEITLLPDYSSQALAEAWVDFSAPLIEAFPDMAMSLNYATPSQANISGADSDWVLNRLIDLAGDRAAFQSNDLSASVELDRNKYQTLVELKQQGFQVGFQMVSISSANRFGGEFQQAVATGLSAGAEWLEFYSPDLSLIPAAGDYNFDGVVNLADYAVWRDNLGSQIDLRADGSGNLVVDSADYEIWETNFRSRQSGSLAASNIAIPEPPTLFLLAVAFFGFRSVRNILHVR